MLLIIIIGFIWDFKFWGNADFIEILFVIFGFGLASGPITWIYFTDILPDIGVSICIIIKWIF